MSSAQLAAAGDRAASPAVVTNLTPLAELREADPESERLVRALLAMRARDRSLPFARSRARVCQSCGELRLVSDPWAQQSNGNGAFTCKRPECNYPRPCCELCRRRLPWCETPSEWKLGAPVLCERCTWWADRQGLSCPALLDELGWRRLLRQPAGDRDIASVLAAAYGVEAS